MHFNYTARARTGAQVTGTVEVEDRIAAIRAIQRLGHVPISVTSRQDGKRVSSPSREKPVSTSASEHRSSGLVPDRLKLYRFAVVAASAVLLFLVVVIVIRYGIRRTDRSTVSEKSGALPKEGRADVNQLVLKATTVDLKGGGWQFLSFAGLTEVHGEVEFTNSSGKSRRVQLDGAEVAFTDDREMFTSMRLYNKKLGPKKPYVVLHYLDKGLKKFNITDWCGP